MKPYKVPEIAKKYVEYDMIQAYTELPDFPDSRARLLFAFLVNQRIPLLHSELYSLVTSLVQIGMDTHDMIDSNSGQVPERDALKTAESARGRLFQQPILPAAVASRSG